MKEEKVYYYGSGMGRSLVIIGAIGLIFGLVLCYFILRDVEVSITLFIAFWQMTLLLLLFIGVGIIWITSGIILLRKSANRQVLLRLTPDEIINYERRIALKWSDIEEVKYIGFRNKHGIGVKMKNKDLVFNQLPLYSSVFNRIFGLSLFDALSGEYIEGDGRATHQEIKEYHEGMR